MQTLSDQVRPRWKRNVRVWLRWLKRRRAWIAGLAVLPILVIAAPAVYLYLKYAAVIDDGLRTGLFPDSANIYAAPLILSDGDGLRAEDLAAEMQVAGYDEADTGKPGTFRMLAAGAEIFPLEGSPARVVFAEKQRGGGMEIARIDVNGRDATALRLGNPLIANLSGDREKRRLVRFDEIPPLLVHAVVSAEDKRFFQHSGLDLPRVVKAAWVDFRDGRKEQGASTLTMQLVRGLWLRPEKRWKRKLAEAAMTIHLERKWPKEKIFETYANEVYLGRQAAYSIHGFAEGAEVLFGRELRDLSLPQAALMAGMVQRPSYFNPFRNPARSRERRDLVLTLMLENRYITQAQYRDAVASPLGVASRQERDDSFGTGYFLDRVGDEIQNNEGGDEAARSVYTTLDLNLQRAASEAIAAGMKEVDATLAKRKQAGPRAEAALIAIDPHTGEIKAFVGGRDYARSQLDRVLAMRPPGSVFKPFVYAAAMNTGIAGGSQIFTPATLVTDEPTTFWFGGKAYEPGNFRHESFGSLTLRQALAHSDNVAAVKVAQSVGFDAVVGLARRVGLNDGIQATPAVALGAYAVTPLEMAGAWTAFANGGVRVKPVMVSSVAGADGTAIHTTQIEARRALDPRVTYLMVSMLEEVMRSGTAAGVRSRGFLLPAAGKTGTSHDGWFAGFTSQLLCVVWVGFDDYRELDLEGAKSALPIWTEFMKRATRFGAYRNAREFPSPGGIDTARVCLDSGKLAGDLCTNTRNEVFIAGTEPQDKCDMHGYQSAQGPDDTAQTGAAAPVAASLPPAR